MGKVIIVQKNQMLILVLLDENSKPLTIQVAPLPERESMVGNIYVGRIQEIAEGIRAAFVAIDHEQKVFLTIEDDIAPLLLNREYDGRFLKGDELVIQIITPALKTKLPTATLRLSLTGQYCVCKPEDHGVSYSKKLTEEKRKDLKEAMKANDFPNRKKYGFVIRTNAGELTDFAPVMEEMREFAAFFDELTEKYRYRTLYSCLYRAQPEYISLLKDIPVTSYEEIVTDIPEVFEQLKEYDNKAPRLYQDNMLSLSALYSIETHLKQALDKKVWLPSGGYLVIEPTEAMVVIDVNSGKGSNEKNAGRKNLYLKINLEAAKEIARQLRLRNYSGMIMVDFINMDAKEDRQKLLTCLEACLKEDSIRTRLVDMTALGIVEITRKKVSRPLMELLKGNKE